MNFVMFTYLLALIIVMIDLFTKSFIQMNENLHSVEVIKGFFSLTYVKNTGMAWSLLSNQTLLLTLISLFVVIYLAYYCYKHPLTRPYQVVFGLIIGGAAGNLYDRAILKYVRDFLDFIIFGYDFPVFNIADYALTIGVILLLILQIKEEKYGKA